MKNWKALAIGVDLGGVGFVLSSLANIIVIRFASISVKDYHRYAIPYFLLLTSIVLCLAYLHLLVS